MRPRVLLATLAALTLLPAAADAQRRGRGRDRDRDHERDRDYDRDRDRERRRVRVYRTSSRYRDYEPSRHLSLMVGVLDYDFAGDNFPMAALRADWRLTRFLRSEVDVTYALGEVADTAAGAPTAERNTSLGTATVGIQAQLPFRYVRPYVGAAVGLFGRLDEGDGASFVRPTHAFPVGVRVPVSPRLMLRGEVRFRFDQHENNTTAENVERTAGLSFAF